MDTGRAAQGRYAGLDLLATMVAVVDRDGTLLFVAAGEISAAAPVDLYERFVAWTR